MANNSLEFLYNIVLITALNEDCSLLHYWRKQTKKQKQTKNPPNQKKPPKPQTTTTKKHQQTFYLDNFQRIWKSNVIFSKLQAKNEKIKELQDESLKINQN